MHTFPRQPGSPGPTQESCRAGPGHTGTAPGKLGTGALHALRGGRWGAAGKPTTPATAAEGSPLTAGPDSRAKVGGAESGGDGGAGYRPARGPARGGGGLKKAQGRQPAAVSSEPPPRNKGLVAGRVRPAASGSRGKETFPGMREPGPGRGRASGARRYLRPEPPARRGPPAPLTSSMAATVFRHCAVRVVKLEAVGAL